LTGPVLALVAFAAEELTRDGARADAERELAKRIYHLDDPSWLERVVEAVLEWLGRLVSAAIGLTLGGAGGLVLLGVIVLVIAIAARLGFGPLRVRDLLTDRRAGARTRTAADYRAEAAALAQRGAWRDAVRARFRAVIRELEERGVMDPRPGRTAGEVAREAGLAVPAIAGQLRAGADVFDEIWYGGRPAGEPSYRRITEVDEAVRGSRLAGLPVGAP
jgi:hypothetical protein